MAYTDRSPIIMQGKIFIAERQFNGPLISGWQWLGNADNAKLSFKQKRETIKDNFTGRGLTIAAPVVETDLEFAASIIDISSPNFARSSWGTWGGAEDAGAVSGEAITLYNNSYAHLKKTGVSDLVVAGASLTTDYTTSTEDLAAGRLFVVPGAAAVIEGTPLETTVSYNYAANNGQVEGFTTAQKFFSIIVDGKNVSQNLQPFKLWIYQIQLDAFKAMDFIDKKQIKLDTGGEILLDDTISDDGEFSQVYSLRRG